MEGEEIICVLCKKRIQDPRQCPECNVFFCSKCINNYYIEKGKRICPSCKANQNLDNYKVRIDLVSSFTFHEMIQQNTSNFYFCVECCKDFNNESHPFKNHHLFNSKLIREKNILNFLKDLNKGIIFQNKIKENFSKCHKNISLLNSTEKIKLDEIENLKRNIQKKFEKKRKLLYEIQKNLKDSIQYSNQRIEQFFDKIREILNNKSIFSSEMYNTIDEFKNKMKNENEEFTKKIKNLNSLFKNLKFESFIQQDFDNITWRNNSFNKSIEFNNLIHLQLYIYELNKINFRIDLKRSNLNNFNYDIHLQFYNDNNILEIPTHFEDNNENNELISFIGNYGDKQTFNDLMRENFKYTIFVSRFILSN